jgi:hypothetical protein
VDLPAETDEKGIRWSPRERLPKQAGGHDLQYSVGIQETLAPLQVLLAFENSRSQPKKESHSD